MVLSEFENSIYLCRTMLKLIEMEAEQQRESARIVKSLIWYLELIL